MRDPETFDAFYRDARERLLAQTFALTGDVAASRRAVRDAFVVAWHHWRKLSRHDDPETVVRPHAWRLAQRHHTARVWHRDKDIGPDVRATLDALGKLSAAQRRALVLTQLAAVSMPQMAREVGLPLEAAERELSQGATQLSLALDVQTPALRALFDEVAGSVAGTVRWQRSSIVRRAGAARRRTHTAVGVAGAVGALVVSGALVTDAAGVRPTLDRPATSAAAPVAAGADDADADSDAAAVTEPPPPTLGDSTLLTAAELGARFDRRWSVASTGTNDDGTGLVLPCQLERYADPRGVAAMVRTFDTASRGKGGSSTTLEATQLTEASSSTARARRTFRTTASWFGDCSQERVQLVTTGAPREVGDQAVQLVLRSWGSPRRTYLVSVARTGVYTTTAVLETGLDEEPLADATTRRAAARLLSGAVDKLCTLPEAGACGTAGAVVEARKPLPAGVAPAMLSELDLPPVTGVRKAWVGTEPRTPITNDAASSCDGTRFRGEFDGAPFTNNATRTFLIPEADRSAAFGLTQTIASLPGERAAALVEQVRDDLAGCDGLNTEVTRIAGTDSRGTSLSAWRLELEVADDRTVTYLMSILRDGTSVAQLGFLPDAPDDLGTEAFLALSRRALERLAELPGPRRNG